MISVVTPVYNGRNYIEACIQSVISQNCPHTEHIIIDGGSTDDTVQIIRKYGEKYNHIRWLSEKDRGQSDAMNKGIVMAKGEILAILNVDDAYEPGVLNRVTEIFKDLPQPALIVGNCHVWDEKGNLVYVNKPHRLKLAQLLLGPNVCPYPINPSAYFCHKLLLERAGNYNEAYHMELDVDFLLRAVQVAHVYYFDEIWGNFRLLEGTKTWKDIQSGADRASHLMKLYRKDLTRQQRAIINVLYPACNSRIATSILYFWRNPSQLFPRLKARIRKMLQAPSQTSRPA